MLFDLYDAVIIVVAALAQLNIVFVYLTFKNVNYSINISAGKILIFADADTQVKVLNTIYLIQKNTPAEINY